MNKQFAIILIILVSFFLYSCKNDYQSKTSETTLTNDKVLDNLHNLDDFNVVKSNIQLIRKYKTESLPSPSDISLKLIGTVIVDSKGWENIKNDYKWVHSDKNNIPHELKERMPDSVIILISPEFNETFKGNPTFTNGFVVIADDTYHLYILSTDLDHPIIF